MLGIVTLLMQAPIALALAHQVLAIVVFTVAVVHAERLCHRPLVAPKLAGAHSMIDIKMIDGVAVMTLKHGKVNALDTEFCDALAARFTELRTSDAKAVVITGQGKVFSAGVDLIA